MSNYKTFDYFVNAYFHQDWREEAKNSEAILELFLTSEDIENIRIRYSPMSRPNYYKIKIELG